LTAIMKQQQVHYRKTDNAPLLSNATIIPGIAFNNTRPQRTNTSRRADVEVAKPRRVKVSLEPEKPDAREGWRPRHAPAPVPRPVGETLTQRREHFTCSVAPSSIQFNRACSVAVADRTCAASWARCISASSRARASSPAFQERRA